MASVTEQDEKSMATDVIAPGANEGDDKRRPGPARASAADEGGFFHIYKKGQGYYTRMGTAAALALIVALTVNFFYTQLPVFIRAMVDTSEKITDPALKEAAGNHATALARDITLGICGGFIVVVAFLVFWLMNKPTNADFMIATDSEMKKVNWTSRKELIGSTKVVIIFMFLIAGLLFAFDIIFGYLFYLLTVLKTPPF